MGENSSSVTGPRESIWASIRTMFSQDDDGPKKLTTGAIADINAIYNPEGLTPSSNLVASASEGASISSTQPALEDNMFGAPPEALEQYLASIESQQRQS
jgi:hypothetical protein